MRYRLLDSLGTIDANHCNKHLGASLDPARLKKGEVIDLPEPAAAYLSKKYPALLEAAETVKAVAKPAAIQGTPSKAGTPKDE